MLKERLRVFLEQQGVVLPFTPDELAEVIKEHEVLRDEILLWATFQFGLPFADISLVPVVEEGVTGYMQRLRDAKRKVGVNEP